MTEEEIAALQKTNSDLVERVGFLETEAKTAYTARDDAKKALADNTGDDELRKELDNYKTQLSQVEADKDSLKDGYTKELNSLNMKQMLKDMGVETHNSDALSTVADLVLEEAIFKDGSFTFLKEDGTTRFNEANKPYSVTDKINDIKDSDKGYHIVTPTGGGVKGGDDQPAPTKSKAADISAQYNY